MGMYFQAAAENPKEKLAEVKPVLLKTTEDGTPNGNFLVTAKKRYLKAV
jgi:hypothetical protein